MQSNYKIIHKITAQDAIMSANALVQTRIDLAVKEEAAHVLAAMGLTVSDAVRLLLTRIATEKKLPFAPLTPNPETIAAIKEARRGKLAKPDPQTLRLVRLGSHSELFGK